jgi:hypothetical protein
MWIKLSQFNGIVVFRILSKYEKRLASYTWKFISALLNINLQNELKGNKLKVPPQDLV